MEIPNITKEIKQKIKKLKRENEIKKRGKEYLEQIKSFIKVYKIYYIDEYDKIKSILSCKLKKTEESKKKTDIYFEKMKKKCIDEVYKKVKDDNRKNYFYFLVENQDKYYYKISTYEIKNNKMEKIKSLIYTDLPKIKIKTTIKRIFVNFKSKLKLKINKKKKSKPPPINLDYLNKILEEEVKQEEKEVKQEKKINKKLKKNEETKKEILFNEISNLKYDKNNTNSEYINSKIIELQEHLYTNKQLIKYDFSKNEIVKYINLLLSNNSLINKLINQSNDKKNIKFYIIDSINNKINRIKRELNK